MYQVYFANYPDDLKNPHFWHRFVSTWDGNLLKMSDFFAQRFDRCWQALHKVTYIHITIAVQ